MNTPQPTGSYKLRERTQEKRKDRLEREASAQRGQPKRRSLDEADGPKPKQNPKELRARTSAIARLLRDTNVQTEQEETASAIVAPVVDIAETADLDEIERICIIADDASEPTESADNATDEPRIDKLSERENVQDCKDESVTDALDAMAQAKDELAVAKADMARQTALNNTLQTSYNELSSRLETTEKEKDEAMASIETLKAMHAENMSRLRVEHKEDRKRSESEKVALQTQLASVSKRNEELNTEVTRLQSGAAERESAFATDLSRLRLQHEEDDKRSESEKAELRAQLDNTLKRSEELGAEVIRLQADAAERERALATEKKTVSNLQHEVASLRQDLKDRDAESRKREADKKTIECDKLRLKKEVDTCSAHAKDLDRKLKEAHRLEQKERSARRKEEDEHKATQRKLKEEKAHHEDTENRLQRRNEEIVSLRAKLRKAESTSRSADCIQSKREPPALDFATKRKLQAAEEQCNELKDEVQRLGAHVRKLEGELVAAKAQQKSNEVLDDELLKKDLRVTELENTVKSISEEADGLRRTIEIMAQEIRDQEDKWGQDRQALVKKCEEKIDSLKEQMQDVEASKKTLEDEKSAKEEELVWKKCEVEALEKSKEEVREKLVQMNEAFKSREIERIIRRLGSSSAYLEDSD
ncbi:hypothetical protein AAVH_25158 [Aphelenchoides avenae]|nr:hypothetical protein AAVH_25158 [Aphelenchus avenae]